MKFTKIRLKGPTNVDLPLLGEPIEGKFLLKGIDGLDPVGVDVLSTGERRPQGREPVFLVGLQPEWEEGQTTEQLRTELYGLLTPRHRSMIRIEVMDGNTVKAYADAQVKQMEAGIFTKDPEVQITFVCQGSTKSYLLAPTQIHTQPEAPDTPGFFTINNVGDAPSGFKISIQFIDAVPYDAGTEVGGVLITDSQLAGVLTSANADDGEWMWVRRAFAAGERLIIDTRKGQRNVWSVPAASSNQTSRLNDLDEDSVWMNLHSGINDIYVNRGFVWYENGFSYTPAYWGI